MDAVSSSLLLLRLRRQQWPELPKRPSGLGWSVWSVSLLHVSERKDITNIPWRNRRSSLTHIQALPFNTYALRVSLFQRGATCESQTPPFFLNKGASSGKVIPRGKVNFLTNIGTTTGGGTKNVHINIRNWLNLKVKNIYKYTDNKKSAIWIQCVLKVANFFLKLISFIPLHISSSPSWSAESFMLLLSPASIHGLSLFPLSPGRQIHLFLGLPLLLPSGFPKKLVFSFNTP